MEKSGLLLENVVEGGWIAAYGAAAHGISDVTFEGFDVSSEVFCCFFVKWIGGIRFQEEVLTLATAEKQIRGIGESGQCIDECIEGDGSRSCKEPKGKGTVRVVKKLKGKSCGGRNR